MDKPHGLTVKQDERKTLTTQSMASATKVVAEKTRDVGNIVFL